MLDHNTIYTFRDLINGLMGAYYLDTCIFIVELIVLCTLLICITVGLNKIIVQGIRVLLFETIPILFKLIPILYNEFVNFRCRRSMRRCAKKLGVI